MKNNLIISFVMVFLSLAFAKAQRGIRVGYIDMEYILDNVPEYQKAKQQLEQKMQKWKQEIDAMNVEIENLKTGLQNERVLLTKELIEEKEEDIHLKEEDLAAYQQKRFGATQGDFILQQQQLIKPVQDQVFNEIQKISELKKYDYVMNASEVTLLFAAERHDISDQVLKAIGRTAKKGDRSNKEKEKDKEDIDTEMKKPYLSVEEAENKDKVQEAREAILKERADDRSDKQRERDSTRSAKKAEYEARRQKMIEDKQKRRDSIQKVRDAARNKNG
jgi:Skp family chaperone for outer membrane proteins